MVAMTILNANQFVSRSRNECADIKSRMENASIDDRPWVIPVYTTVGARPDSTKRAKNW